MPPEPPPRKNPPTESSTTKEDIDPSLVELSMVTSSKKNESVPAMPNALLRRFVNMNRLMGGVAAVHGEDKRNLKQSLQQKIKLAGKLAHLQSVVQKSHEGQQPGEAPEAAAEPEMPALPPLAHKLVGSWKPIKTDNYSNYLKEVVGLGMMIRKIAEKIPISPTYTIEDGMLHCECSCPGAKAVNSTLAAGKSTFYEPNMNLTFECDGIWADGPPQAFKATRSSPKVLKGATITAFNVVDEADQLVVTQCWGNGKQFTSTHVRVK